MIPASITTLFWDSDPMLLDLEKHKKTIITIQDTPTGFLRVREEPSIEASEEAQVKPGDTFGLLDEKDGWYKINYEGKKEGWVYGQYAKKTEE